MKHTVNQLRHLLCTTCGLCLAISVLTALLIVSVTGRVSSERRLLTADKGTMIYDYSDSPVTEIPVKQQSEKEIGDFVNLQKAYKTCVKIINSQKNTDRKDEIITDETQSTTSTTFSISNDSTTVTTTVTSQTSPTTTANRDTDEEETETVSNEMQPFNYNDVSSIADGLSTLGDFADKLQPDRLNWDVSEYSDSGCVKITLDSQLGCAVLYVKPVGDIPSDDEQSGTVSGEEISGWQWLQDNRSAGCNISSVTWKDSSFGIAPVRDIGIGSTLAELTDRYLCVNGGATTLYRASDILKDQNKLNAILSAENLYTFVGGRVYSIGSYLDKYYNGREHTFIFEDCDYVVQYGCNSIMEHNYTTGSWIIEYAVKEDSVIGISFMNKSYYKTEQKTAISTNIPSSGSEYAAITTTRAEIEDSSEDISEEMTEEASSESEEINETTETDGDLSAVEDEVSEDSE